MMMINDADMIIRENQQCFAVSAHFLRGALAPDGHVTKRGAIDRLGLARRAPFPADRRTGDLAVAEGLNLAKYWVNHPMGIVGLTAKVGMIYRLGGFSVSTVMTESKRKKKNVIMGTVQTNFYILWIDKFDNSMVIIRNDILYMPRSDRRIRLNVHRWL